MQKTKQERNTDGKRTLTTDDWTREGDEMLDRILYEVKELKTRYKSNAPFEIAKNMNINVTYDNLGALKGYYFYQSRFRYIVINQNIDDKSKNIICAHELGYPN